MMKSLLKTHIRFRLPTAIITIVLLVCGFQGVAQNITVSGVVRDAEAPLPGVSILEKGTTQGTASDAEGNLHCRLVRMPCWYSASSVLRQRKFL
jgi:hypothetical protein